LRPIRAISGLGDIAALLDDPQYANALKDQMRPVRVAS